MKPSTDDLQYLEDSFRKLATQISEDGPQIKKRVNQTINELERLIKVRAFEESN